MLKPLLIGLLLFVGDVSAKTQDANIDVVGNTIRIHASIYLYGDGASVESVRGVRESILDAWERRPDGRPWTYTDPSDQRVYTIEFDVDVFLYGGKPYSEPSVITDGLNPFSTRNYIRLTKDVDYRSYVGWSWDTGKWAYPDPKGIAHEFGHILGLRDRYTDKHGANEGWEGNIMANHRKPVEQRNIDAVVRGTMRARAQAKFFKNYPSF